MARSLPSRCRDGDVHREFLGDVLWQELPPGGRVSIREIAAEDNVDVFTNIITILFFSRVCYQRLKLLLVAVTAPVAAPVADQEHSQVLLNPGSDVIICEDTKGFFICQSEEEVKR